MFRQHFSARHLGFLQTTELLLMYSASQARNFKISTRERVNQSTAEPGVNHSAASVFLLILLQQQHVLFGPAAPPPSLPLPVVCSWQKLRQVGIMYNQGSSLLDPNPVPALRLE